jgi:hypothetical protein
MSHDRKSETPMTSSKSVKKKLESRSGKGRVRALRIVIAYDSDPDVSWLDQSPEQLGGGEAGQRDYELNQERLRGFERGDWNMTGVWVEADVFVGGTIQTIRSDGIWGIESDSGDYYKEVAKDEYRALKDILRKMGFKKVPPFSDAVTQER